MDKKEKRCFETFVTLLKKNLKGVKISLSEDNEFVEISAPLESNEWGAVEPAVSKRLDESGLFRFFEIAGAGTGFGNRDIFLD